MASSFVAVLVLWLLSPFVKIKVAGMIAQRMGHLALNTDLFFRRRQIFGIPKGSCYIFIAGSVANRQLLNMWKRQVTMLESRVLRGLFHYGEKLWKRTPFYEPLEMNTNEYFEYQNARPTLKFTPEEEIRGRAGLQKMGINPDQDWFVCVFARDPEYLKVQFGHQKNWSYHDFRNADINTFIPAIQAIIERGGHVLRMGHHVSQPLLFDHDHVIDYALKHRDDFMDVYLAAHCRFFLGTTSGICDLPMIFDVPRITTNAAPPVDAPKGKRCLFIPKKVRVQSTGRYLPFGEFIRRTVDQRTPLQWYVSEMEAAGLAYEDNSPEEIRDVTLEMMERLSGTFQQTEEDRKLQQRYFDQFPPDHWAASIKTPMGQCFLRKYQHLLDAEVLECDTPQRKVIA